ncbi:hypothetical protein B9Q00_01560 [Candidatus Marsarchaeota G1 archaeon OSP_C]|uniref:Uncharacterized protein n=1 Tax=Candidatus Marsarchaeota G1 archaeon OSP_C TaxID=1978154 RepID=A0A2R6ASY0_9ARCH|nr:MAG: hypothetical protein B9Q00_01560 [Candidatus Marsarchaeota G1 archaeon OSP_C]
MSAFISFAHASQQPVKVLEKGHLLIHGKVLNVLAVMAPPSIPQDAANVSYVYPTVASDWQYGPQWGTASDLGGQINITYFQGGSGDGGFSYWIGLTDNVGNFYQAGISFWPSSSCSVSYTGWAVDNVGHTSSNPNYNLTIYCPGNGHYDQFNYHNILYTLQWTSVIIYLYQGQWYVWWNFGNGTSIIDAFPSTPDGATGIQAGSLGAIFEGGDSFSYTSVNSGAYATDLMYVWKVAPSGNTLYIYLWFPSSFTMFVTGGTDAPPINANFGWIINPPCPGLYLSYFSSGTGSIPASGSSIPMYTIGESKCKRSDIL